MHRCGALTQAIATRGILRLDYLTETRSLHAEEHATFFDPMH